MSALYTSFAGALSANSYLVHNLVADQSGIADHTDPNLVNPWGNAFSATSPFWVGNNHTGTSTLYDGSGTPNTSIVVQIPSPGGSGSGGGQRRRRTITGEGRRCRNRRTIDHQGRTTEKSSQGND